MKQNVVLGLMGEKSLQPDTEALSVLCSIGGGDNPVLHKPSGDLRSDAEISQRELHPAFPGWKRKQNKSSGLSNPISREEDAVSSDFRFRIC